MDGKVPHILIVDDDVNLLATTSDIFMLKGYEPVIAQTGSIALAQLEERSFDVALVDLRLEDMSGLEVLRAIKVRSPETECILLTGHATQNSAIEAIKMGVYGFFQKPFDMEQVLLSIQQALEKTAARKALRESERFAHATVDALSSHLAILDETGTILAVNKAWREFAEANSGGSKVCEGANYLSVCDTATGENSEEAAPMAAGLRAVISGKQTEFLLEYPCHYSDQKRWFIARVTRFPGEGPLRIVVSNENITERVLAEEALRQSQYEFRVLFELSPDAVMLIDPHDPDISWPIVDCNAAACLMNGYSRDELIGHSIDIVNSTPGDRTERDVYLKKLREAGHLKLEAVHRHKNGTVFPIEISTSLIMIDKRELIIGIDRDITGRKLAEAKLRQSEEQFQQLANNVEETFWITDAESGDEIYISPAGEKIWGMPIENLYQGRQKFLENMLPEDRHIALDAIEKQSRNIKTEIEYRVQHPDGSIHWVLDRAFPVLDETGRVARVTGVASDITERKRAEELVAQQGEQLRLLYEASQRLNRTLDLKEIYQAVCDFMSVIAPNDGLVISSFSPETQLITCCAFWMENKWLDVSSFPPIPLETEGKGTQSIAIRTGQPMLVNDFQTLVKTAQSSYYVNENEIVEELPPEEEDITRSALIVPLKSGGVVNGVIQVISYRLNAYTENQLKLLEALALHIASAEQNAMLYARVQTELNERKQAEKSLHEREEQYRTLVEQLPAIVYIDDSSAEGRTLYVSPQVETILGFTQQEWQAGSPNLWMKQVHPDDLERVHEEYVRCFQHGEAFDTEYRIRTSDGRLLWFRDQAVMLPDENGKEHFIHGLIYDITERKQSEESLRISEERLRVALNATEIAIWDWDIKQDIWYGSPNYYTMLGYEPENGPSDRTVWLDRVDPQNREYVAGKIKDVLDGRNEHYEYEAQMLHADGSYRWHRVLGNTVARDKDGKATRMLGIRMDITERKQSEENIRQHIKELELLYESGLAFSQLLDPKAIAQKIIKLLGEKLNWHHTVIRLADEQNERLELLAFDQPGLESNEAEAHFSKYITHFGEGLSGWALQQSRSVRSGDVSNDPHYVASYPGINSGLYVPLKSGERVLGVISIESEKSDAFSQTDEQLITTLASQAAIAFENARLYEEIKGYAEELEQRVQERTVEIESTRRRLELAVKTAGIGIWELDIKQNRDYWDEKMFELYGFSKEKIQPSSLIWRNAVHPDDLALQEKMMDESLRRNQPYDAEFRVVWPDASVHHIKSSAFVVRDAAGEPERMIGADQDITLHKLAEETLRLANAEMERGLRMKNEFLANMSHELRTPLNAILGISESLAEQISGSLNEKQIKYVGVISESGRHLLDLINDILDLSKIEAGKLEIDIQPISVERLCASSLRMVKELAQKKSLNVSLRIDENVKVILGDERRLKQSLVNLFSNAVKFTPQGKRIGLDVSGNAEMNEATFTVWDEGIGISQDDIKLLFQPFVQLNAGLTREYAGTGLGLSLVAQMVRLHGGRIELTSELGMGSRFMITLPWMPAEQQIQSPIKPLVRADSPRLVSSRVETSAEKRTDKILIVDDTEVVAQLVSDYLQRKGYKTIIAYDGREAVALAGQEHPQIILMDVMMPVMSGLDATRQIRTNAALKDVPIIGLTALAMPDDREQCLAAGMNAHVSKPIEMQELERIIERYLKDPA